VDPLSASDPDATTEIGHIISGKSNASRAPSFRRWVGAAAFTVFLLTLSWWTLVPVDRKDTALAAFDNLSRSTGAVETKPRAAPEVTAGDVDEPTIGPTETRPPSHEAGIGSTASRPEDAPNIGAQPPDAATDEPRASNSISSRQSATVDQAGAPAPTVASAAAIAAAEPPATAEQALSAPASPELTLSHGDDLLTRGNVLAARMLFVREAMLGSAAAATAVGKTYDPTFLASIKAVDVPSDRAAANAWYNVAAAMKALEAVKRSAGSSPN